MTAKAAYDRLGKRNIEHQNRGPSVLLSYSINWATNLLSFSTTKSICSRNLNDPSRCSPK